MKILSFANQKGGVAKTTTSHNVAVGLAIKGYKVLAVDLDPQASLTISFGVNPNDEMNTTAQLFDGVDPRKCCLEIDTIPNAQHLYLCPADITLANTEKGLIMKSSREHILQNALKQLSGYFDICIIDCPPQLGMLLESALVASDAVIIPCKTDFLAYKGLKSLLITIDQIKESSYLNPDLKLVGVIATMYESIVNDQKDVLRLIEQKCRVIGVIKKSADAYRSVYKGIPVIVSQPHSEVAQQYNDIISLIEREVVK